MDSSQPGASERERSYRAIRSAIAALEVIRPGTVETASFLLTEAKSSFEHAVAESANSSPLRWFERTIAPGLLWRSLKPIARCDIDCDVRPAMTGGLYLLPMQPRLRHRSRCSSTP